MLAKQFLGASDIWRHFAFYSGTASPFQFFGRGGEERMLVYPVLLWMAAFAGYLMASRRAKGQDV